MRRLEREDVIISYHARLDLGAIQPVHTAFVQVALVSHRALDFARFEDRVRELPQIVECHAVGGETDYSMKVVAGGAEDFERVMTHLLAPELGVERVMVYPTQKIVKSHPQPQVSELFPLDNIRPFS